PPKTHERSTAEEEEGHGVEVGDEVLPQDASEPVSQQLPRKLDEGAPDAQMAGFVAVPGGHGHVLDDGVEPSEQDEHRALEEVPGMNLSEIESGQGRAMDRDVAVGRVEDMPLSAGGLDEKREPR